MPRQPQPMPFDGALVIHKPKGKTSHDVVDAVRHLGLWMRSEEHTSELQSRSDLVCRLLLEKKKTQALAATSSHSIPDTMQSFSPMVIHTFTNLFNHYTWILSETKCSEAIRTLTSQPVTQPP